MTRRERQMRREWCYKRMYELSVMCFLGKLLPHMQKEENEIESELAHYARQDRRRAKRRNTK